MANIFDSLNGIAMKKSLSDTERIVIAPGIASETICFHCGQPCEETLWLEEKPFCCYGCKTVYELLSANDLCTYYALDNKAGVTQKASQSENYAYLDETSIREKLLDFDVNDMARVRFSIPAIHCISCIWLLENLPKLDPGVIKAEVNFARKRVSIVFNPQQTRLSNIAQRLHDVGYAPHINLEGGLQEPVSDRLLVLKLALAGFCFGNVMLFSFPEYLGLDPSGDGMHRVFSFLNLALSIPVFFYSAAGYFRSAWQSFKQKQINIDVPIAAGLLALFARSTWEITTGFGPGYLDSFTGLVFFLLIGRWFQGKTYESLAFDRDFKSYFPLAVQKITTRGVAPVVIYELNPGDRIRIRNLEIIPADSVLTDMEAYIDYSFVTGESRPVKVLHDERIYAGGRLVGQPVTLVVEKKTSQSHLTSLWNHEAFRKEKESGYQKIIDRAARRFTWVVLALAAATAVYWHWVAPGQVWLILTSVLMVACPCALALAAPFTYGSMLRVFGRHQLYLKNADVIERMSTIDAVVFDKTGTITTGHAPKLHFTGVLSPEETQWIKTLTASSTHPLSTLITRSIDAPGQATVSGLRELPGRGIEAAIDSHVIRIGSAAWVGFSHPVDPQATCVFVSIDGHIRGHYTIHTTVRHHLKDMLGRLKQKRVALLSGDNEADRGEMSSLFGSAARLFFHQSPHDKLAFIQNLQQQHHVMMLGDGLNDSGALKQSDVGLAVTDDTGVFTPACDGILHGSQLASLDKFLALARSSTRILKTGFVISFMYNAIALTFAITGHLTPLVAAILMPISSISVVGFASLAVRYAAWRKLGPSQTPAS
jgi:Cu+-exporting ATPase